MRLSQYNEAKLGDEDIANGIVVINEDSKLEADEYKYILKWRYTYLREHKLAAINYFQTTWKMNKDDTFKHILARFATCKLKIT